MRMRRKKHGVERIAACSSLLIQDPALLTTVLPDGTPLFRTPGDLQLEIGCGKGDFAVGMAAAYPHINFIAMERVADVACLALEKAMAAAPDRLHDNLRFLIGNAENLGEWLAPGVLSRIYLNFSDPWPKAGYAKRRLTHRRFLELYRSLLRAGGELWLKTDNEGLFDFSLEEFSAAGLTTLYVSRDFHAAPESADNIMTEYERNFSSQGKPIFCARVRF